MYNNIGGKIKGLAVAAFIFNLIVPIIACIAISSIDDEFIPIGIIVLIVGFFFAWVSTWLLYGYGELIEKTCAIERNTRGSLPKSEIQAKNDNLRENKINELRAKGLITVSEYEKMISK